MKLMMKQRVFSWTDSYDIYDEDGNTKYLVKGEFLSLGHQLHVYNNKNQEIGAVRQRLLTFLPAFEIEIGGVVRGNIRKEMSMFRPRYTIDFNGWSVSGDFMGWEYEATTGNRTVLHISKQLLAWGDTYVIEIEDSADEQMGLLLVIAIDAANCDR